MGVVLTRLICFGGLLALLAASAGVSLLVPVGGLRIAFHLGAALAQALLIVLVFLRVAKDAPLIRIMAAGATLWLAVLFVFTFLDYAHR